jgi:hypothetical protein
LIDNALDADATEIEISVYRDGFTICDNGNGIEDIMAMFQIGTSGSYSNPNAIGQYGVGGKHAVLEIGTTVAVSTVHGGSYLYHEVDWLAVSKMDSWPHHRRPNPIDRAFLSGRCYEEALVFIHFDDDCTPAKPKWNTCVEVRKPHKGKNYFNNHHHFLEALANIYRPALQRDVKIVYKTVNGLSFNLAEMKNADPVFDDGIECNLVVNGKKAKLIAGICDEHISNVTGMVHIAFINRVIETPRVVSEHSLPTQIFCQVELSSDWKMSMNTYKNEVKEDRDELLNAVWYEIEPIVDLINELVQEITMTLIDLNIGKRLEEAIKATHKKGTKKLKEGGKSLMRKPGGKKGKKKVTKRKKPWHPGELVEGDKDHTTEDAEADEMTSISVSILRDEHLGGLLYKAKADRVGGEIRIEVALNPKHKLVDRAYEEQTDALEIFCACSLSEAFIASDRGGTITIGHLLFDGLWQDENISKSERIALLASDILHHLSDEKVKITKTKATV